MNKYIVFYELYMYFIGFLGASSSLFQAYKIIMDGRAENVSLMQYVILFVSMMSWLVYGISKKR